LIAIVLAAHFVPPERSAVSPDSLATLQQVRELGLGELLRSVATAPNRPLLHALFALHATWTWDAPWRGVLLLAGMAMAVSLLAHALFRELLRNEDLAFTAAVTYALLPNKLELFHTGMYAVSMVMHVTLIGAALLFLRALRRGSRVELIASLLAYAAGCFITEGGVFLPLALLGWATALRLPRIRWLGWFAVPLLIVLATYLAAVYQAPAIGGQRTIQWARIPYNAFVAAPQFFAGRFMARAVLYGLTQFWRMETPWIALALCLDAALFVAAYKWISRTRMPVSSRPLLYASAAATVVLLIPNILYFVEDRHLALPDLGFAIVLLPVIAILARKPAAAAAGLVLSMVVAQGNAWNHVVACRINGAMQHTLNERSGEVAAARVVLFDLASFTDRIPYTWGERAHNPLAAYYGAQVFAPWGLSAAVRLAGGRGRVVASPTPVERMGGEWEFTEWRSTPSRQRAPADATLVIGYADVYRCGFSDGKRGPCP
jgi:hypothetical protein